MDRSDEGGDGLMPIAASGHLRLSLRLRAYLLTGIIVTAPIAITLYLVWQFITFLDERVGGLIPDRYNPETYLPFSLPGLGLISTLIFFTLVGMITAGFVGRAIVRAGEQILSRMPIIRSIYSTLKQVFETVLKQSSRSFREVVLIEYPRLGMGAIGFVTGPTPREIQERTDGDLVNVFLPTTPNPTSGFLLFVRRKDLIHLDISVEEGMKLVISGGIVSSPRDVEKGKQAPGSALRAPVAQGRGNINDS